MTSTNQPVLHIAIITASIIGGLVWLVVYASHFSSIEFDGPAALGLSLCVVAGGLIGGLCGAAYNINHKKRFKNTVLLFIASLVFSSVLVTVIIGGYASSKWDYAAAHEAECQIPADIRPLACE